MAASIQREPEIHASPVSVPYLKPSAGISCGCCEQKGRPLWWGICAWCGADEEDFESE